LVIYRPVMANKHGYDQPGDEDIEAGLTADLAANDCGLPPERCTPEEGIAIMQKRIDYLCRCGKKTEDATYLADINRELATARARLREYQLQRECRN
jgi:hypothetical protein